VASENVKAGIEFSRDFTSVKQVKIQYVRYIAICGMVIVFTTYLGRQAIIAAKKVVPK
jgi:cell division protein FtsL